MNTTHKDGMLTVTKTVAKKDYQAEMILSQRLAPRKDILAGVLESWIDRYAKGDTQFNVTEIT